MSFGSSSSVQSPVFVNNRLSSFISDLADLGGADLVRFDDSKTINDKLLGLILDITDSRFGCVPNDTDFDNTAPFQAAMDYAETLQNGAVLWSPRGVYTFKTKDATTKNIIKLRPKVSIMGEGDATEFKADDGIISTDGFHFFRNDGELIQNVKYSDFKINNNGLNNFYPSGLGGGFGHAIRIKSVNGAETTKKVIIDNITFYENSGAQNIVLTPSDDLSNFPEDCVINNCRFYECGYAIAGNVNITDHSSILGYLKRGKVTNNTFFNSALITSFTVTAIELHCRETVVAGNTVENWTIGNILAGQVNGCFDNVVALNVFKNVDIGISIWNGVSGVGGQEVTRLKIDSNIIILSNQSQGGEGGITVGTVEGAITNSAYTNNTISALGSLAGNGKNPKGIFLAWAEDCLITGNNLFNLAGKGIEVSNSSTSRTMKRILISNNQIRDIGLGGVANNDYGVHVKGLNASFVVFDAVVSSNQITGSYGSSIVIDGYVNGVNIQNNASKASDLNPVKFINFNATNIVEGNNWVEAAGAQPTSGFYVNGTVIRNNVPVLSGGGGSVSFVHGWRRLNNGDAHVNGVDWVPLKVFTGS